VGNDIVVYFKKDDMSLFFLAAIVQELVAGWKWLENPGQITQGSTPLPRGKRQGSSPAETHGETEDYKWDYKLLPW